MNISLQVIVRLWNGSYACIQEKYAMNMIDKPMEWEEMEDIPEVKLVKEDFSRYEQ